MPPASYGEFSLILRERVGCPSSLTTYEIVLEITNKLAHYDGILNVVVSRPNFIVHLATLEQQLDMLSWKELIGPGYVLDIAPWTLEDISLEFPWITHTSTQGLPSETAMIKVDTADETMQTVSSPDFSYLLILELKDFYHSKVDAFLKCEEAWKHICSLTKPFSEDVEQRIASIYKQSERYSSMPPTEILSTVADFGARLNYQELFVTEEIFGLHITMESIYRHKKDPVPLNLFQLQQPNGKVATPTNSKEFLKKIFEAAVHKVYPGTAIMTTCTEADNYMYTNISSNTFNQSYKVLKPATKDDAEAISNYRFLKYITNVVGYCVADQNWATLNELVWHIRQCTELISDFQYCVNSAVRMISTVEKNIKDMYTDLLARVPPEEIPSICASVDSFISLLQDYNASAQYALNTFSNTKQSFRSIKFCSLYPAKADEA